jgi:hypothetical protein
MLASDVSDVIRRLDDIQSDASVPVHHKLFSVMYRQVTAAVAEGIANGDFEDGPRMDRFDTLFANRYLRAFERHRSGQPCSGAWRIAFEFADSGRGLVLQHLLLGMNAHINLDLAIAAARVAPGGNIDALRDDFERINDLLANMIDGIQGALGEFSPLVDPLDRIGGGLDEGSIEFSIQKARAAAWEAAEVLAQQPRARQRKTIQLLDRTVKLLGRSVIRPRPLVAAAVALVELTESDDIPAIIDRIRTIRPQA